MPVYVPQGSENPFGQIFSQINYVCDRIQIDRGVQFSVPFRILFYSTLTAILEDPSPAWLASQETRVLEFGRLMERLPDIFSEIATTENVAGSVTYFEGLHWLSEHLNSCALSISRDGGRYVPKIADHPSPWTVVNDYTKTVVTLASALLAFTGTFSTSDRMAAGPRWPLFLSWVALVIAIAAALYSAGQLTRVLNSGKGAYCCLLCANISYFALFGGIILFLIFAVLATEKQTTSPPPVAAAPAGSIELVEVGEVIPAFASGSATETSSEFAEAVCKARRKLKELGSATAIVVGHHDREELTKTSAGRFASNMGLAQQRADWVAQLLQNQGACDASPIKHVLAVVGGPRKTDPGIREKGAAQHAALADDRRVEIEALRYVPDTTKPAPENHATNLK